MLREQRRQQARAARAEQARHLRRQLLGAALVIVLVVAVPVTLAIVRASQRDAEAARAWASAQASASAHAAFVASLPLVAWTFEGAGCADGWGSPSIGHRGACSSHGGEVGVWRSDSGVVLRCTIGGPPLTREEQYDQREAPTWQGAYWCE